MAKYLLTRNCFFEGVLHPAGTVVDFGDVTPPKTAKQVLPEMVTKAKAVVAAKSTPATDADQEDALLKAK